MIVWDAVFKAAELVLFSFAGGLISSSLVTKDGVAQVAKEYKDHKFINAAIELITSNNITAFCYTVTGFGVVMSYLQWQQVSELVRQVHDLSVQMRYQDSYGRIEALIRSHNNASSPQQGSSVPQQAQQQQATTNADGTTSVESTSTAAAATSPTTTATRDPRLLDAQTRLDGARRDLRFIFSCTSLFGTFSACLISYLTCFHATQQQLRLQPPAEVMITEETKLVDGTVIARQYPAALDAAARVPKHGDPNLADIKIKDNLAAPQPSTLKVHFYNYDDGLRWSAKESFTLPSGGEVQNHKDYSKAGALVCLERDGKEVGCKRAFFGARYNTSDF